MPEPLPCDLLVFDLDGTLIDSEQDLADSVNATLVHLNRSPLAQHQVASFIGDGATVLLERALSATGKSDTFVLQRALRFFLDYYREHKLDTTYAYPGVLDELQRIRNADSVLPIAVLTNKPVVPAVAICNGLGLSPFFFTVLGGNSLSTKKPEPEGMRRLMSEAALLRGRNIDARRTVLVGDSHVDVETARAAGVLSLGCTYGLGPERLLAARPDAIVNSPSEWLNALRVLLLEAPSSLRKSDSTTAS